MTRARAQSSNHHAPTTVEEFAADVRYYLSLAPPQLPSRYFYDEVGSALFEVICRLPWYGITRAETGLLAAHGSDIIRRLPALANTIELGPGSGEKLWTLLDSAARHRRVNVHLIDVSPSALAAAAETVSAAADVRVFTHCANYEHGLREAAAQVSGSTLVMFLGSNIGNFDPPGASAFLQNIRGHIEPGDALLLGTDLVKPESRLLLAYDDPLGVTAAFNLNLLERINRDLGAAIDLRAFFHRAVWNGNQSRVEMHLVARTFQTLRIPHAHVELEMGAGDSIWTESSYKYDPAVVGDLLCSCGFDPIAQWIDRDDQFALTLAKAC